MVRIPSEYQEVEYIESTGTQWIDSGILTGQNLKILAKIRNTISVSKYAYGVRNSNATITYANGSNSATGYVRWGYSAYSNVAPNGIAVIEQDASGVVINGTKHTYNSVQTVTPLDGYTIAIFAAKTTATNFSSNFAGEIYYFKIYDGEMPLLNFIPCYRKSSGEIGMYDTVSKQFYTNSGTGTFLKGNDVTYDNINLLESRRRILLNTPHIETVSDTIASFKTDVATKLKGCKIHFTPIQEGEGDPSPENVRPITGWDGVTVTRCGKNLCPASNGVEIKDWERENQSRVYRLTGLPANMPITLSVTVTTALGTAGGRRLYLYGKSSTFINTGNSIGKKSITVNTTEDGQISISHNNTALNIEEYANAIQDIQLELGSTATPYEPYTVTTLTIPFNRTIYGGYVDLVKGEVVEEYSYFDLNSLITSIQTFSNGNAMWYKNGLDDINVYSLIDDYDCSDTYKVMTYGVNAQRTENNLSIRNDVKRLYIRTNGTTDIKPSGHAALKLATPNTYPIDPQTLKALRGMNNIWSDANGNIEVSFYTH